MMFLRSQAAVFLLIAALTATGFVGSQGYVPAGGALAISCTLAVVLAWRLHDGRWWCLIHALFLPAVVVVHQLALPAWYFLGAAILLWLLSGSAIRDRVPLYFSGGGALQVLVERVPPNARLIDLGAGTGRVLAHLHRHRPDLQLSGIERSPLLWLLGRCSLPSAIDWRRGDLRRLDLSAFDCVYVFLSSEPMATVWEKVCSEMGEGGMLISNSFAVPDVRPDDVVDCGDWKGGKIMFWRIA
ncbi:class I SAM-dependent methyltransferase [Chitinilyticum litopenaei]|uniref:class I SAM-dependent methyltransferase n=1 Tax=Chitinilyticum litopenaei TaxID=1121276 RepID=UPI0006873C38|nr:class I SAM-dependent methyltransferase [Chitinilyticum litopenaei]